MKGLNNKKAMIKIAELREEVWDIRLRRTTLYRDESDLGRKVVDILIDNDLRYLLQPEWYAIEELLRKNGLIKRKKRIS